MFNKPVTKQSDISLESLVFKYQIYPHQQCAAACTGAIITSLTMTPLDVVKTRLQTQQKTMISNKCFLYCNGLMDHLCPCPNGFKTNSIQPYQGTIDAFLKISRSEGLTSLWSGLGPTLVLAVPATVIYFVCYEHFRESFKRQYVKVFPSSNGTPFLPPLLAGMTARTLSVSIFNPLELVRTKLQSEKLSYFELGNALKSMIARQGFTGLWTGLGPTLWRDVPFSGIYWTSYEMIKSYWNVPNPGFWCSFFGGATSGCIAAFITTPFDVVKTHKQIAFGERFLDPDNTKRTHARDNITTLQSMKNIYRTNGFSGLFAGVTPRLAKIAPACAIMIASYENGKMFFHNYNVSRHKDHQNFVYNLSDIR